MKKLSKKDLIEKITRKVLNYIYAQHNHVPVGISNKHVHLSREHCDQLFGLGYTLTPAKKLMGEQFAAKEKVKLIGPKGVFEEVRVAGPIRDKTQIEISITDSHILGIEVPIRNSGDLDDTPGVVMVGPQGVVDLEKGLICAKNHIHMTPKPAEIMDLKDGDYVKVKTTGVRSLTFEDVLVRVREDFNYEMHVDLDEANAANLSNNELVEIIDY